MKSLACLLIGLAPLFGWVQSDGRGISADAIRQLEVNKNARIVWPLLINDREFRPDYTRQTAGV